MMSEVWIGIIGMFLLYLLGHLLYPDVKHKPIIPEPNGMLSYSKESALLGDWEKAAFGDEEE